jgi:hypothetical protein
MWWVEQVPELAFKVSQNDLSRAADQLQAPNPRVGGISVALSLVRVSQNDHQIPQAGS